MAFNQLLNSPPFKKNPIRSWLIVLGMMACFAYYQYSDGYNTAKQLLIKNAAECEKNFPYHRRTLSMFRRTLSMFKEIGCESQVADRADKLETQLGFEASNMSDEDMLKQVTRDWALNQKANRAYESLRQRCEGIDAQDCIEDTPQDNSFSPAPSAGYDSHTPLSPEECDKVDNAGFLPECRGW